MPSAGPSNPPHFSRKLLRYDRFTAPPGRTRVVSFVFPITVAGRIQVQYRLDYLEVIVSDSFDARRAEAYCTFTEDSSHSLPGGLSLSRSPPSHAVRLRARLSTLQLLLNFPCLPISFVGAPCGYTTQAPVRHSLFSLYLKIPVLRHLGGSFERTPLPLLLFLREESRNVLKNQSCIAIAQRFAHRSLSPRYDRLESDQGF